MLRKAHECCGCDFDIAVAVAFVAAVASAVGLQFPLPLTFRCGAAVCARQKMDQKWTLSEPKASFVHFPFFAAHKRDPEGQRLCGL